MRNWFAVGLFSILSLTPIFAHAEEVNLYSARMEDLIKPILDRFTEETGIEVNLVTGNADALLKRLESEGKNSPADLIITTDAGRLYRAKAAQVLQPIESKVLSEKIPPAYRDPDGYWVGLSLRARPILYVKGKVDPTALSSYEDLANPKWKKRICIRSSDNIYNQSLVASLIAANGVEATEKWAAGFVQNFAMPPKGGDRDQIKAAASGICDIAIANTYYLGGMMQSTDPEESKAAAQMAVFWPNQKDRGAHVNVSGAGVTVAAKNKANAIKLLEFLVSEEAQRWYAKTNNEYPVVKEVQWSDTLKSWGTFKADALNLAKLGENNAEAVRLMDRVGWK